MGAQPGDCLDSNSFTLPSHENLSEQESAEKIANHFAAISQEFPPLNIASLPNHVQTKLLDNDPPPLVSEYDTHCKIRTSKKPKSGVPNDLPRKLTQEFSPELALPISRIINNIITTCEWPYQWRLEYVTPIPKTPLPESEDELRPISLTSFFSKVTERFVVNWLLDYIKDKIDFKQYGGLRGSSITHYLIEFINFILWKQDGSDQVAILACMVDFSKAFNRQNHNILITKLCDMGVPSWLLKIVIAFLSDRRMVVRYKGKTSNTKSLPGGGPQGTLLGLLLFLVLINDVGFEDQNLSIGELITSKKNMKILNELHLKYVDDLTVAESINLQDSLVPVKNRTRPEQYHARTGHTLPIESSKVHKQLQETRKYCIRNEMKINEKKTKVMLFNPSKTKDFMPDLRLGATELEVVSEIRLLGIIIQNDMKWKSNTANLVTKANKKLWIVRRLKYLGAGCKDLIDVYIKHVRSILELAVPAWQGAITQAERLDLERIQKSALHIILGDKYESYNQALKSTGLKDLELRRRDICLKFALRAEAHWKHKKWFKPNTNQTFTRQHKNKYDSVQYRHTRFRDSPISYLTNILNTHYRNK